MQVWTLCQNAKTLIFSQQIFTSFARDFIEKQILVINKKITSTHFFIYIITLNNKVFVSKQMKWLLSFHIFYKHV